MRCPVTPRARGIGIPPDALTWRARSSAVATLPRSSKASGSGPPQIEAAVSWLKKCPVGSAQSTAAHAVQPRRPYREVHPEAGRKLVSSSHAPTLPPLLSGWVRSPQPRFESRAVLHPRAKWSKASDSKGRRRPPPTRFGGGLGSESAHRVHGRRDYPIRSESVPCICSCNRPRWPAGERGANGAVRPLVCPTTRDTRTSSYFHGRRSKLADVPKRARRDVAQ